MTGGHVQALTSALRKFIVPFLISGKLLQAVYYTTVASCHVHQFRNWPS